MADPNPIRILLVKDGDNFYMRHLAEQPPVHVAYIDTSLNNADGQGTIRSLIPGRVAEDDVNTLLDLAKTNMEGYVQSGNFDRDREITRLNDVVAGRAPANAG